MVKVDSKAQKHFIIILSVLSATLFLVVLVLFSKCSRLSDDLARCQSELDSLKDASMDVVSSFDLLKTSVESLSSSIDSLSSSIDSFDDGYSNWRDVVYDVQTEMASVESDKSTVESQIDSFESDVNSLESSANDSLVPSVNTNSLADL